MNRPSMKLLEREGPNNSSLISKNTITETNTKFCTINPYVIYMVHKLGRIGCLFARDLLYSTTYTRLRLAWSDFMTCLLAGPGLIGNLTPRHWLISRLSNRLDYKSSIEHNNGRFLESNFLDNCISNSMRKKLSSFSIFTSKSIVVWQ